MNFFNIFLIVLLIINCIWCQENQFAEQKEKKTKPGEMEEQIGRQKQEYEEQYESSTSSLKHIATKTVTATETTVTLAAKTVPSEPNTQANQLNTQANPQPSAQPNDGQLNDAQSNAQPKDTTDSFYPVNERTVNQPIIYAQNPANKEENSDNNNRKVLVYGIAFIALLIFGSAVLFVFIIKMKRKEEVAKEDLYRAMEERSNYMKSGEILIDRSFS